MKSPLTLRSPLLALVLVGLLHAPSVTASESARPNVLLVVVDDLNDWVGCLKGHPQALTPNIDSLADRGLLFTRAYCSAPGCNASRTSFLFGVSPTTSGVFANNHAWRKSDALKSLPSLPIWFRQNGYRTLRGGKLFHAYCFSKNAHTGNSQPEAWDSGFPSKTQQIPFGSKPKKTPVVTNRKSFYRGNFDWAKLDEDELAAPGMSDTQVVDWAIRELTKEASEKPFFMAVGIYRPHVPWYVPSEYFDRFPIEKIKLPPHQVDDLKDLPKAAVKRIRRDWHQWILEQGQWKAAVQAYLASMAYADDQVGRLLKALEESEYSKNTVVILCSDHGYHLGEKQHWEKFVLWDQATHVPFIIAGSGIKKAQK